MAFTSYTTRPRDRWDLIANRAYGDVEQVPRLLAANREVGSPVFLPPGIKLRIPIAADTDLISPDLLPPWKR